MNSSYECYPSICEQLLNIYDGNEKKRPDGSSPEKKNRRIVAETTSFASLAMKKTAVLRYVSAATYWYLTIIVPDEWLIQEKIYWQ